MADDATRPRGEDPLGRLRAPPRSPSGRHPEVSASAGPGRSTLVRTITGHEKPDGGTRKVGETVQLAYMDQSCTLDPNETAWEEISGGNETIMVGRKEMNPRADLDRPSTHILVFEGDIDSGSSRWCAEG